MLKRCSDILITFILIIIFAIPFFYIFKKIKKDGGDAIYGHERVGQFGKKFKCYKFRSMVVNSDEVLQNLLESDPVAKAEWDKDFKLKNDPRITKIGHFIRKTSLDELPQLWNVLKGEMSLVGPRPIVEVELERYGKYVDDYLSVKPGLTGLWQISGRNDISYQDRVLLDVEYVKNQSFFGDLVILAKTAYVVIRGKGAY